MLPAIAVPISMSMRHRQTIAMSSRRARAMVNGGDLDSLADVGQLKQAVDADATDRVQALMSRNPALHKAPLGYGKDGPLTWVAECRVPWEPPGAARLSMAAWMIDNGSDVHQGGDGPLMRAALNAYR